MTKTSNLVNKKLKERKATTTGPQSAQPKRTLDYMTMYNERRRLDRAQRNLAKAEAWRNQPITKPDKFMDDAAKLYLEKLIRERYHY